MFEVSSKYGTISERMSSRILAAKMAAAAIRKAMPASG
jgi:hypothetical protein